MASSSSNSKRLVKNTLLLYVRMFLIMAVSFFTTRVILKNLGFEDYGIYNTIGGVVVLFSFINTAMVSSTQRFLNFHLGKEDEDGASNCFSVSIVVHVVLGLLIVLLTEMVGMTFLYTKMSLPPERFTAALWTLQFSIIITFINVVRSPYNACIIAHERMEFYAYLSILEAILKLAIVYLLTISPIDRLITYGILLVGVNFIITFCYKSYCNKHFELSKFRKVNDKSLFKKLLSFSGFSLMGNAANVATHQGQNMLINVFSGVIANAAVGVSSQLSNGVYSFCHNFQVAFNPQLVKTYAKGDLEELKNLIIRVSKLSFFLMFILAFPIMNYCKEYLTIWLKDVPDYSSEFCVYTMLFLIVDAVAAPLWITIQATGNIKRYQTIVSLLVITNLPVSWLLLSQGFPPTYVYISRFVINVIALTYRFFYVNRIIKFDIRVYLKSFILPVLSIVIIACIISRLLKNYDLHFIIGSIILGIAIFVSIMILGLNKNERIFIVSLITKKKK